MGAGNIFKKKKEFTKIYKIITTNPLFHVQ